MYCSVDSNGNNFPLHILQANQIVNHSFMMRMMISIMLRFYVNRESLFQFMLPIQKDKALNVEMVWGVFGVRILNEDILCRDDDRGWTKGPLNCHDYSINQLDEWKETNN